jgi:hypothetical protein
LHYHHPASHLGSTKFSAPKFNGAFPAAATARRDYLVKGIVAGAQMQFVLYPFSFMMQNKSILYIRAAAAHSLGRLI